jgi:hypothetical protein
MRLVAPLLLLLPGCVFLGAPPPQTATEAPPPKVTVEFAGLFGGQSVRTLWNNSIDREGLMARVVIDEDAFRPYEEDSGTEPWTLQLLLSRLGTAGSITLTEPLGPPPAPRTLEDGTVAHPPAPSAAIRNLRFLSGTEEFPAVVERTATGLQVRSRVREDEESFCSPEYTLPVGFVFIRGTLQKLPFGEVVAVWDELALTPAPAETSVELDLPSPTDAGFCDFLTKVWFENETLAMRDAGYIDAAMTVLDMALSPVLP